MLRGKALYAFVLGAALTLPGCTDGRPEVTANSEVVETSSSALTASLLQWANGTYGTSCTTFTSGSGWSVQIAGGAGTMDNNPLSVVMDNTGCTLTLTSLVTNENTKTTYTASPSIVLGSSYAGTASSFANGSNPIAFYGNAMLSSLSFASNFTLDILYSDDPSLGSASLTGVYTTVTASSFTTDNAAPNYTLSLSALTVSIDNLFVVESVAGTADLTAGSVTGDQYYVDQGTLTASPTFAQIDSAYASATKVTIPSPFHIAASSFGLMSTTLPQYRTIVIHNVTSGVASYQTFYVTFNHP